MTFATVGKGGSGKTTVAGTLARIFAEEGTPILAIDGDPNPNLALTLGMSRTDADNINYIPPTIMRLVKDSDGATHVEQTISTKEIMDSYASQVADSINLIVMGQPEHGTAGMGCMCGSHRAVRGLIAELTSIGEHTVTDMEAGLEHLRRGTARHVDMMLVVAEPYYRSLEAAKRTSDLAVELGIQFVRVVANKVRHEEDLAAIETFCKQNGMTIIGQVPHDETLMDAERNEQSPYDYAERGPGVEAIRKIAAQIEILNKQVTDPNPGGGSPEVRA